METVRDFNIGGLVKVRIRDKSGRLSRILSAFHKQYENFVADDSPEEHDLTVTIGNYAPELHDCYSSCDGRFYFKEDYLHVRYESLKGGRWGFEIRGLNEKETKVNIDCNELGRIFIEGYVIDFMIHLKLLKAGYPMIHASSVKKADHGFLFASRGGGGKTTIAMQLSSSGFDFMGDNYTILHNGSIFGFPTSLNIFTYNITPRIIDEMSTWERGMLKMKGGLYNASGGYAKFFTKLNPNRVFDKVGGSARLDSGFFLLPTRQSAAIGIREISISEYARMNLFNQMLEFPHFDRYIKECSYFLPSADLSRHWGDYLAAISDHLSKDAHYYLITVPTKIDDCVVEKICQKMLTGASDQERLND